MKDLENKNIIVTGASGGIGNSIVEKLNDCGTITYNHDEALKVMLPKLNILPCWAKRGYWSQSTNAPKNVLASEAIIEVVNPEVE
jgi:NAD(P)-dependent dehydrogenase (short-subunit alcohol dehydrogenase family)